MDKKVSADSNCSSKHKNSGRVNSRVRWYLDWNIEMTDSDRLLFQVFSQEFCERAVLSAEGMTLPGKLGMVRIVSMPTKPLDIAKKNKYGWNARFLNHPSDGLVYKVRWFSSVIGSTQEVQSSAFMHSNMYAMRALSRIKVALVKAIRGGVMPKHYQVQSYLRSGKYGVTLDERARQRRARAERARGSAEATPLTKYLAHGGHLKDIRPEHMRDKPLVVNEVL
jgi:hypothetical protein